MAEKKFAVIKSGAHEYLVEKGDKIEMERIPYPKNGKVVFAEVLLVVDGDKIKLGKPKIAGVKIEGKVLREFKSKKVLTIKFKAKKRYKRTKGHRQNLLEIEITKV